MTHQRQVYYDTPSQQLVCEGDWNLKQFQSLKTILDAIQLPSSLKEVTINGKAIQQMDSAGAWLLLQWQSHLQDDHLQIHFQHFSEEHKKLLSIIQKRIEEKLIVPAKPHLSWLARIGKDVWEKSQGLFSYLAFIGELSYEFLRILRHPKHFRVSAIVSVVFRNGYQALPIIALLSFMIGVVITYQMGLQLRSYGANVFIVDLLGLSILREFGPLLTAIMVAGRTGSAFTAQLGMMKLNQEIDALNTMGVTPAELLLLPRVLGLFIALPLLTMWADIFGVIGGMVMSNNMLNITWGDFLRRFPNVIPLRAFLIGFGKAPVFALIIASTGCFQGMQVKGSADSVGRNTTRSVVMSIFFIIVADAIFSIIFSKLKL